MITEVIIPLTLKSEIDAWLLLSTLRTPNKDCYHGLIKFRGKTELRLNTPSKEGLVGYKGDDNIMESA